MYYKDSSKIRDKYFFNIINKYTFRLIQSQNRSRNIYVILVAPISHYMSAWNCRAIKNRAVLWNNESLWNACVACNYRPVRVQRRFYSVGIHRQILLQLNFNRRTKNSNDSYGMTVTSIW